MCNFGTHVERINKWAFTDIRAAHNEYLPGARIFIIKFIVILPDPFHELVNVPLVQGVDQFQAFFLLVFLDEIVGA